MTATRFTSAAIIVAGNPPTAAFNSGDIDEPLLAQTTVPGVNTVPLLAGGGVDEAASCFFATPLGPLAASGMRSTGIVQTNDTSKSVSLVEEAGGGGASTLVDYSFHQLWLALNGLETTNILAMGAVEVPAGVPGFTVQDGSFQEAITDNGAGDFTLNTIAERGIGNASIVICTPRQVLAASELRSIGIVSTPTTKTMTLLQEGGGGAASALTDYPYDFVIFGDRRGPRNAASPSARDRFRLHALGSVINGGAASLRFNSGAVELVTRLSQGSVDVQLQAGAGLNANNCVCIAHIRRAVVASRMQAIGILHTSDTLKNFTTLAEAAVGGASTLEDLDFDFAMFEILGS